MKQFIEIENYWISSKIQLVATDENLFKRLQFSKVMELRFFRSLILIRNSGSKMLIKNDFNKKMCHLSYGLESRNSEETVLTGLRWRI